jgi:TolA-binding protein
MAASRGLPAAEREQLTQARDTIGQICSGGAAGSLVAPAGIKSAPGREFLAYLQAADAFYAGEWDAAHDGFATLRGSKDAWLAETAAYMLARTELNAAQAASFDVWGTLALDKVDKAALDRARAGFEDYLKRHARGRYAASAQGLMRRTLWLAGDAAGLSREYERMLGTVPAATPGAADLVEEIDN